MLFRSLKRCKPILKKLKGWKCSISGITEYDKLPKECREYVEFAEKDIGVPITMVSNCLLYTSYLVLFFNYGAKPHLYGGFDYGKERITLRRKS